MTKTAENYVTVRSSEIFHRQARKVWNITVAVIAVWVLAIVIPPIFAGNGYLHISSPLYHFFSFICHQIPDRSFHILENQLGVCSRCFGVYSGLLAGLAVYPMWRSIESIEPLPRIWLFASMIPIAIDWSLGVFGIWENNHASRFVTGLILGIGCATYIMPALVEIVRSLAVRKGYAGRESPPDGEASASNIR